MKAKNMNPKNLVCDGNRVLSKDGQDNWDRIFGKKRLPIMEQDEKKQGESER